MSEISTHQLFCDLEELLVERAYLETTINEIEASTLEVVVKEIEKFEEEHF